MCKKLLTASLFIVLFLFIAFTPSLAQKGQARPTVWHVYPAMDRLLIQAVVDGASNGDTVYFHAGTYDWSNAPVYARWVDEGAINIIDKTLTIKGEPGNLIKGPDSVGNVTEMTGLCAFQVVDLDTNNDVTFIGLNIRHFMRGVQTGYQTGIPNVNEFTVPNTRNVTVRNCVITDIARQAISISDPTGNIAIENNILSQTGRGAIWLVYRGPDFAYWQPDKTNVKISGNTITTGLPWGLYAERTKNFRVENNIFNVPSPELGQYGIAISGAKKGTVVASNAISNYQYGIYTEGWSSPPNNTPAENVFIDNNKISCVAPVWCFGIYFVNDLSSGHLVTRNQINLTSKNGIGIYSETNHNIYSLNKISGTGSSAVLLAGTDYTPYGGLPAFANHETFLANDVSKFTPNQAHFYLDYGTHENLVIGSPKPPWTYKDFGASNLIIGGTNITNATFQALSAVSTVSQKPGADSREARKNIIF